MSKERELGRSFYERPVEVVACELLGCEVRHGEVAGRIVETEAYHMEEPACHAFAGRTTRTRVLFGPPGTAYVYFSYGIHSLLNAVAEEEGVGAAVLIRALQPLRGLDQMRARRGLARERDLCSGPGKLTQALGIGLVHNGTSLAHGEVTVSGPDPALPAPRPVRGERIGITKATGLPWRFCDAASPHVSRPWPAAMRSARAA